MGVTFRDFNLLHWSFLKGFPLFIWLLFAVSWCLISALTQAGGGGLLFRFASSVQSCCGEGRALQTDIAVCGEHSPCSGHTGFAPYRGVCAFPVYPAQAPGSSIWSGPCAECGSSFRVLHNSADSVAPAFCVFPGLSGSGSQRLVALSPGVVRLFPSRRAARAARGLAFSPRARRAPSLRGPSARSGLRKSLGRTRGLCAGWEGVASLGLSFPLVPPPASYLQRGWGGSSLEFLSPFVLRTAGGVFRPVNFSLTFPQFKKSPSDCSQGLLAGPHPKECRWLLSVRPLLLVAGAGVWGTFLLGVAFRHIICGPYLVSPPS